jgi:hypothetical protein
MPDDKSNRSILPPSWLTEPPAGRYGGILEPPDPGKQPLLPKFERFPHLRPPPRKWRRTLRQKLSEL